MEEEHFLTITQIKKRYAVKNMSIKELAEFFDISEWTAERVFRSENPDKARLGVNIQTIYHIKKKANDLPYFE